MQIMFTNKFVLSWWCLNCANLLSVYLLCSYVKCNQLFRSTVLYIFNIYVIIFKQGPSPSSILFIVTKRFKVMRVNSRHTLQNILDFSQQNDSLNVFCLWRRVFANQCTLTALFVLELSADFLLLNVLPILLNFEVTLDRALLPEINKLNYKLMKSTSA
jgi:hypothetical protein